jgi:hypothetical protein
MCLAFCALSYSVLYHDSQRMDNSNAHVKRLVDTLTHLVWFQNISGPIAEPGAQNEPLDKHVRTAGSQSGVINDCAQVVMAFQWLTGKPMNRQSDTLIAALTSVLDNCQTIGPSHIKQCMRYVRVTHAHTLRTNA